MKTKGFRKFYAIIMIALMVFWSALPSVSMAFFIKPGEAIKNVSPITGVSPMTVGEFMVPGNIYEFGNPVTGVQPGNSGQIIIPQGPSATGQFILPNIVNSPRYNWLVIGDALTGGDASSNGNAVESGEGSKGGEGSGNGDALQGSEAGSNGDAATGGDSSTNGESLNGGEATNGGASGSGGDTLTGSESGGDGQTPVPGDAGSNADGLKGGEKGSNGGSTSGGKAGDGGSADKSGQSPSGGNGSSGKKSDDDIPSLTEILFPFLDTSRGPEGIAYGIFTFVKDNITDAGRSIMEGLTATYAGFNFRELPSGNYKVVGDTRLSNGFLNHFYDNFKRYDLNGREAYMPVGGANPRPYKVDSFFKSMNWTDYSSPSAFFSTTMGGVKTGLNESFNVFSKSFWSGSNMLRLNGPVNIATSAFESIYDYTWGDKKGEGYGSKFAADLTVDLAVGATTTVLSSVASSMAAGAVAGSVVPGLGTVVGAVAGLLVGVGANYLINGTRWGKDAKGWVSDKLSKGYSWVADKAKGLFGKLGFGS